MTTNLLRYPINSIELSPTSSIVAECQHIFSSNFFSRVYVIFPCALGIMSMTVTGFKCPASHEGNPDIYKKSPRYDLYDLRQSQFTAANWYVWPRLLHAWQIVCFPVLSKKISTPAPGNASIPSRASSCVRAHFPQKSILCFDI